MKILCVFGRYNYGDPTRGDGYEYTNFLPALRALGHDVSFFDSWGRSAYRDFAELNRAFLKQVERDRPDVVLCVLMGYELWTDTLDVIRSRGLATVLNWGTDDSWKYEQFTRFIAPHFDWCATTYPDALGKARREGVDNIVLTQWAASRGHLIEPLPAHRCTYQVTFVGSAYGNRRKWINRLRTKGIQVHCFGHGWPSGPVASGDLPRIYRESVLTLNFGDSGLHFKGVVPYHSRQIKARVFEVPGAGGCLLTESADGLERYFRPGKEVLVFSSLEELVVHIRHAQAHPRWRDKIAQSGFERVRAEHTYEQRFSALLSMVENQLVGKNLNIDWKECDAAVARHKVGWGLHAFRRLLVAPSRVLFGDRRGPRAARRLLFELSWRLVGAHTYSAAGWPGRVFYKES